MGKVVISGSLGGVMVSTRAGNVRVVGSIPALCVVFPIFITPITVPMLDPKHQIWAGALVWKMLCF